MTRNILKLADKMSAYKVLMPFIKESAIFIPGAVEGFELGEQIQVDIDLLELGKHLSFRGSIVWLSFESSVSETGVGVKFEGIEGKKAQKILQEYTNDITKDNLTDTL